MGTLTNKNVCIKSVIYRSPQGRICIQLKKHPYAEVKLTHAITTPSNHTHTPENLSHGGGANALNVGSASCFAFGGMEVGVVNWQARVKTQQSPILRPNSSEQMPPINF